MGYSIITLQGMNAAYEAIHGVNIFNGISLPEGIDRDTLIGRIAIRCGEFSVMHSDPEWFHDQTVNFFLVHFDTFDKWIKVLSQEYDPLENYNRHEIWHDQGDEIHKDDNTDTTTLGSKSTTTKAAFNSSSYEPYEQNSNSGTDKLVQDRDGDSNYRADHEGTTRGNIGVMTSQQMAQQELDLRRFNIYKEIANLYADEFCVQVY